MDIHKQHAHRHTHIYTHLHIKIKQNPDSRLAMFTKLEIDQLIALRSRWFQSIDINQSSIQHILTHVYVQMFIRFEYDEQHVPHVDKI